eukprot:PhM_4_TR2995/c0_g1_i1/m.14364/K06677/YCS4, CNAP1, CAPD2; condensin complex subunit 1
MDAPLVEFNIPQRAEDLEVVEGRVSGCFYVDGVMSCNDMGNVDQITTLQAVLNDLSRRDSCMAIRNSEKFDVLYSFVKQMDVLSKDCIVHLAQDLPQLLLKLTKMVAGALHNHGEEQFEQRFLITARSAVKMYAFLVCSVLNNLDRASVSGAAAALSQDSSMSQQSRAAGRGRRPTGARRGGVGVELVDLSVKETAVRALLEVLSPDLAAMWVPRGRVEEKVVNLLLRTALTIMSSKQTLFDGTHEVTAVGEGVLLLLAAVAHRYISTSLESSTAADVKDIMASPLGELVLKNEHVARFLPKLMHLIDREDSQQQWSKAFNRSIIEVMGETSAEAIDTQSAKNVATFFDEVARIHVVAILENMDIVRPQLNNESYDVRKTVMTCMAELLQQRYANCRGNPVETAKRDTLLESLLERFMDINPFARSHCIKVWNYLWESRCVGRDVHLRVMENVVKRIEDRHHYVRKSAFQLLQNAVRKNPLGTQCLSLSLLRKKHDDLMKELKTAMPEPEVFQQSMDESQGRLSSTANAAAADAGVIPPQPGPHDDKFQRLGHYTFGITFVEHIHTACKHALTQLNSKIVADVLEAMEFLTVCSEYRVDYAVENAHNIFPLIYSLEPSIQEATKVAFCQIYFLSLRKATNTPLLTRNLASAKKLLAMLMRSSEGIIAATETICQLLPQSTSVSNVITDDVMTAVWGVATGSLRSDVSPMESRHAMRLFAILAYANPRAVRERVGEIINEVFVNKFNDNMLCTYLCHALERLASLKSFKPLPKDDPLITGIQAFATKRTGQLKLWLMLAESSMSAIGTLCDAPREVFSVVVQELARRAERDLKNYEDQTKGGSKDQKETTGDPSPTSNSITKERVVTSLAQFAFVIGHAALKELVFVDQMERVELTRLENAPVQQQQQQNNKKGAGGREDVIQKELGFDSREYRRAEIAEQCEIAKHAIVGKGGMYAKYIPQIEQWCVNPDHEILGDSTLRSAAVLSLSKFMIISEDLCKKHVRLFFTLLKNTKEWWIRTNILVALGDLLCMHPNVVQPYLHPSQKHIYELLHDDDEHVRSTTVMVCTHLALNDMLRVSEMVPLLLALVGDADEKISSMGRVFLNELHAKNKTLIYNLLPSICMHLCNEFGESEKFQMIMKLVIEKNRQGQAGGDYN